MTHPKQVLIGGGGISGLATAYYLKQKSRERGITLDITVLEGRDRFGGVIETEQRDGFILEGGPDSFISDKPWALNLCKELGIEGQVIETRGEHRRSFILQKGKLKPVPDGFRLIAPTRWITFFRISFLSFLGKLRMLLDFVIPARKSDEDESVGSFIRRRFGTEVLSQVGQPMLGGMYTADPDRLSLKATFPQFMEMEHKHGSLLKAFLYNGNGRSGTRTASGPRYSLFLSLKEGMGNLVGALVNRLAGVGVHLSAGVTVKSISRKQKWKVETQGGKTFEVDMLCLAIPATQAAVLCREQAPQVADELAQIRYESVVTANFAYQKEDVPKALHGFGYVVPVTEGRQVVGCTFSSVKYLGRAPEDSVLIRAFLGGTFHRDLVALDDDAIKRTVREEFRRTLNVTREPMLTSIHRYVEAMPQYYVGHLERVDRLERVVDLVPGLFLTGNAYRGIGIPDCIHQGELAAERILDRAH